MAEYELVERIGIGGMAEVFRGVAVAGGGFEKAVAIKRILPHLSEDARFVELLIAEAKILSELRQRNIVQIYDVGLGHDGQYFLVMEFVDGVDLNELMEPFLRDNKRLPLDVALYICAELCEALEHAHIATDEKGAALGVVHRDVSPSNVLLSRSGEVKLTDFGLAKRVEEVTGHHPVQGRFAYISPEHTIEGKKVDARSDVYSVGILLYELVAGRRLFSGMSDFDALHEVRMGRVSPAPSEIPGVERALAQIMTKALAPEPKDRYQTAGELGAALRSYRYSATSELSNPAQSISELVADMKSRVGVPRRRVPDDFAVETTTVVVNTAAEFAMSELSGLHQLITQYPSPRIDEETVVVSVDNAFDNSDSLATRVDTPAPVQTPSPAPTQARTEVGQVSAQDLDSVLDEMVFDEMETRAVMDEDVDGPTLGGHTVVVEQSPMLPPLAYPRLGDVKRHMSHTQVVARLPGKESLGRKVALWGAGLVGMVLVGRLACDDSTRHSVALWHLAADAAVVPAMVDAGMESMAGPSEGADKPKGALEDGQTKDSDSKQQTQMLHPGEFDAGSANETVGKPGKKPTRKKATRKQKKQRKASNTRRRKTRQKKTSR